MGSGEGCCNLAAALDYFLRTPNWFRSGLLVGGVMLLIVAFWRWIRPAMRFNPSLTEVALRIEQSEPGQKAGLTGTLAAGLELGPEHASEPVVTGAIERFGQVKLSSVLSGARLGRVAAGLMLAAGAVVALAAAFPTLAAIGARADPDALVRPNGPRGRRWRTPRAVRRTPGGAACSSVRLFCGMSGAWERTTSARLGYGGGTA